MVGEVTLVKFVLSPLPIYVCTVILDLAGIMNNISKELHKFLWQGVKSNHKEFHLLKWETIRCSHEKGRVGIKEPRLLNIAMGTKFIWRIISGRKEWWKEIMRKKYLRKTRLRCLDGEMVGKGTCI